MLELLEAMLTFPAVIFTVLTGVTLVFWTLVIAGAFGVDLIPFDFEVDVDGDGPDMAADVTDPGFFAGALQFMGAGSVPLTIVFSFLTWFAWALTTVSTYFLFDVVSPLLYYLLVMPVMLVIVCAAAIVMTKFAVKPLKPLFKGHTVRAASNLIGQVVTITSSKVTERFGTATIQLGSGNDVLLYVVHDLGHTFSKGDPAVIVDHRKADNVYAIAAVGSGLADEMQAKHAAKNEDLENELLAAGRQALARQATKNAPVGGLGGDAGAGNGGSEREL